MNRALEKNLIDGLDRLEEGASLDSVLASYPHQSEELRPLLQTALQIPQLAAQPTVAAQQKSLASFLDAAAAVGDAQAVPVPGLFSLRRLLMPLASLALILLLLGFALLTISASALPGDGLYGLKRSVEEIRLSLAAEPEQILKLSRQFQEERISEIEALLRAGRAADILFEGAIETLDGEVWLVAGLPVEIEGETLIEGTPQVGEIARVDGRTESGRLIARHIVILTGEPDNDPVPAIIPTVETTVTPQPDMAPTIAPTPILDQSSPTGSATIVDYQSASATKSAQPPDGLPLRGEGDGEGVNEGESQDVAGNHNPVDSDEHEPGNVDDREDESGPGSENEDVTGNDAADDNNDHATGSDDEEDTNSDIGGGDSDSDDANHNDDTGGDDSDSDDADDNDDAGNDDNNDEAAGNNDGGGDDESSSDGGGDDNGDGNDDDGAIDDGDDDSDDSDDSGDEDGDDDKDNGDESDDESSDDGAGGDDGDDDGPAGEDEDGGHDSDDDEEQEDGENVKVHPHSY